MYLGFLIPLLLMLPNFLWIWTLKKNPSSNNIRDPKEISHSNPKWLDIGENIGRLGSLLVPCFLTFNLQKPFFIPALIILVISILLYYLGWVRYFKHNREEKFLYLPLWKIPLPLAIFPSMFLFSAAYLLDSWINLVFVIGFVIFHMKISHQSYVILTKSEKN